MDPTDEQRAAVQERRVSVALSAGAGCGKTHVLTERFLAHLDPQGSEGPPARLSELIAITFTDRAAREMRWRIRRACRDRLLKSDAQEAPYWLSLLRELECARISTIHSFCRSLLQSHAVEAGLDPHFRVLEQAEADTLLLALLDDVLRRRLAQKQDSFLELVAQFGLRTLQEMVQTLLEDRLEIDFEYGAQRTPAELAQRWTKLYKAWLAQYVMEFSQSEPVATMLQISSVESASPKVRQRLAQLESTLKGLAQSENLSADVKLLNEHARVQGISKREWPTEEFYVQFKEAAQRFRDGPLKKLQEFSRWPPPTEVEALARLALHMLGLAQEVLRAYQEEKRRQTALDFHDLVAEAVRLLEGPYGQDVRPQLAAQIRQLLVDEFQDTDPLQVRLIRNLCGEDWLRGKLFFVGDYKQSIYRFRGARPEVFQQLRQQVPAPGQLSLTKNFRSQPAILDFVNALFCEKLGPNYEPLRADRAQISPTPTVEFLWTFDDQPGERSSQAERLRRREADWIARRIRQLLDRGEPLVLDKEAAQQGRECLRAPVPGDITLLFRALSEVQIYEEALRRYEIPYYLVGGHAFYAQQEIYDLVNLLRAIQSPLDTVALVGVLRSPFFNLHDETLYWLAQHPEGLWDGLCADPLPKELEPTQRHRVRFAAATLQTLRAAKDRLAVADLIQQALHQTGYDAALLAEFLGERKLANLHKLIDQARRLDQTGLFTLSDFILQLTEFVARQPQEPLAATFPESSEVVRLMSIHQAKGLEFPIVIVADLDRSRRSSREKIAFSPEFGPMLKPPDFDQGITVLDIYHHHQQKADEEELIRLFYVATTRAADYLILSSGRGTRFPQHPWTILLEERFDLETGQLKVCLPEGYPAPQIRVTQTEPEFTGAIGSGQTRRYLEDLLQKTDQMVQESEGRVPPWLAPVPPDLKSPRRYSFSRLTGQLHPRTLVWDSPQTPEEHSQERSLARAEGLRLGILVHAVLAQIDYRDPQNLPDLVSRLAFRHLSELPAEDSSRIQKEVTEMLKGFLGSDRARQIATAQQVFREVEFLLSWPPERPQSVLGKEAKSPSVCKRGVEKEVFEQIGPHPNLLTEGEGSSGSSQIMTASYLQGFLDCLYQDAEGKWYVVDFKSHDVANRDLCQWSAQYELQMLLYGLAFQEIFGESPAELAVYFLQPGKEILFPWTDASRQWVIEEINRAIDRVQVGRS